MYAVILTMVMFTYGGQAHTYVHDESFSSMQHCVETAELSAREIVRTDPRVAQVDYSCDAGFWQ